MNQLLRVEAPLGEAQLIETALLNIVNFQTLIATKASRIKQVVGDQESALNLVHDGLKKWMQLFGEHVQLILLGLIQHSNVRAGKLFGIPVSGTHAHSMVQAYKDEYIAFHKYASTHKDCVFLVDTYDTLKFRSSKCDSCCKGIWGSN